MTADQARMMLQRPRFGDWKQLLALRVLQQEQRVADLVEEIELQTEQLKALKTEAKAQLEHPKPRDLLIVDPNTGKVVGKRRRRRRARAKVVSISSKRSLLEDLNPKQRRDYE